MSLLPRRGGKKRKFRAGVPLSGTGPIHFRSDSKGLERGSRMVAARDAGTIKTGGNPGFAGCRLLVNLDRPYQFGHLD